MKSVREIQGLFLRGKEASYTRTSTVVTTDTSTVVTTDASTVVTTDTSTVVTTDTSTKVLSCFKFDIIEVIKERFHFLFIYKSCEILISTKHK